MLVQLDDLAQVLIRDAGKFPQNSDEILLVRFASLNIIMRKKCSNRLLMDRRIETNQPTLTTDWTILQDVYRSIDNLSSDG